MKVAITVREGRVSPVFDTARLMMIADIENGEIVNRHDWQLLSDSPQETVSQLRSFGVETLICGAVSGFFATLLSMSGIHLISFVSGEVNEILRSVQSGSAFPPHFLMPGCGRGRRMGHRRDRCEISDADALEHSERNATSGKGRGGGWGRQSLQSLCDSGGISMKAALDELTKQGFSANADSTLKALAAQKGISPAEVRDLLIGRVK